MSYTHVHGHTEDSLFVLGIVEFLEPNVFEQLQTIEVTSQGLLDLGVRLFNRPVFFILRIFNNILLEFLHHLQRSLERISVLTDFLVESCDAFLHLLLEGLQSDRVIDIRCVLSLRRPRNRVERYHLFLLTWRILVHFKLHHPEEVMLSLVDAQSYPPLAHQPHGIGISHFVVFHQEVDHH